MHLTRLCLALSLLAAPVGAAALTVEDAREMVRSRLGPQALPAEAEGPWSLHVVEDEAGARLVAERRVAGPVYRFVRRGDAWILTGMSLPPPAGDSAEPGPETPRIHLDAAGRVSGEESVGIVPEGLEAAIASRLGAGTSLTIAGQGVVPDSPHLFRVLAAARRAGAQRALLVFPLADPVPAAARPSRPGPGGEAADPVSASGGEEAGPADGEGGAAEEATWQRLERLALAVDRYRRSEGRYPRSTAGGTVDGELRHALFPLYLRNPPSTDGWGHDLRYRTNPAATRYELRSVGADGREGTDDDLILADGARGRGAAG